MNLVNGIKKFFVANKVEVIILSFFFFVDLIYLSNTVANVPYMDYWRFGNDFLYDMFNGGIRFSDFWKSTNGQRAFLTYGLFYINVIFFHWNTRITIFFGAIITYVTGLFLIKLLKEYSCPSKSQHGLIFYYISIVGISAVLFNNVQGELKTIEFAAPQSICVLVVVLNAWMADKILLNLNKYYNKAVSFALFLGISICFVFTAFFPAVIAAICICGMHHFITEYNKEKFNHIKSYLIVGCGIMLSAGIYLYDIEGVAGDGINVPKFAEYIFSGEIFKGFALYLGSSIVYTSTTERFGMAFTIFIGCAIGVIYAVVLYSSLKQKAHEAFSYFPLMLILYTLFVGLLLSYGRGSVYGAVSMSASRYAYQSKLGLIGIMMFFSNKLTIKNYTFIYRLKYILKIIVPFFIIFAMMYSLVLGWNDGRRRRMHFDNLIQCMYNIENLSDDDLMPFQAGDPMYVRKVVQYMKIYQLGVFHNPSWSLGGTLETINTNENIYADMWVASNGSFKIRTGVTGGIHIRGFYYKELSEDKWIKVFINGEEQCTVLLDSMNISIDLTTFSEEVVEVTFISNADEVLSEQDLRKATFILTNVYAD